MLNSKFINRNDLQKCQEVLDGKRQLHQEDRLFNKLYDHYVATGQMPARVQTSMDMPAMAWVLEQLEKDMTPATKTKQ